MGSKFIIYGLVDPRTGEVRYIGRSTSGLKRPREHQARYGLGICRNLHKKNWLVGLKSIGLSCLIHVLEECGRAEDLTAAEVRWIALGRANGWRLTNLTDGGEGTLNPPAHHREAIAKSNASRQWTAAARAAIAAANAARIHTAESIEKQRAARLGWVHSVETKAKIGGAHRGRKCSTEAIERMRAAKRGRVLSPEHRKKLAAILAAHRPRSMSPEARAKLSATRRALFANRKPGGVTHGRPRDRDTPAKARSG